MIDVYWPPAIVKVPIEQEVEKLENYINILNLIEDDSIQILEDTTIEID